jgi:hypothetical protein
VKAKKQNKEAVLSQNCELEQTMDIEMFSISESTPEVSFLLNTFVTTSSVPIVRRYGPGLLTDENETCLEFVAPHPKCTLLTLE